MNSPTATELIEYVLEEAITLMPLDKGPSYNRTMGTRDRDAGKRHYAMTSSHSDRHGNQVDVEYKPVRSRIAGRSLEDGHYDVDFYTSAAGKERTYMGRGDVPIEGRSSLGLHVGRSLSHFIRSVRPKGIIFDSMRKDPDHGRKNAQYHEILKRIASKHGGRVSTVKGPYSIKHHLHFSAKL